MKFRRIASPISLSALALTNLLGCSAENAPSRGSAGEGSVGLGGMGTGGNLPTAGKASFGGSPAAGSTSFPQAGSGFGGATGTAGASGVAGSGPAPTTCVPGSMAASAGPVDDLEDGNNALKAPYQGYWYVYNDKSGTQVPTTFMSATAGGSTTSPMFAACTSGSGFTTWGAGMGFNVLDIGGTACPVNAASVTGVRFQIKGTGQIRLQVATGPTASSANGGTCTGTMCDFHAYSNLTLSASWTPVSVAFATLSPGAAPADTAKLIGVQFQAYGETSIPAFDFCVDDVEFY